MYIPALLLIRILASRVVKKTNWQNKKVVSRGNCNWPWLIIYWLECCSDSYVFLVELLALIILHSSMMCPFGHIFTGHSHKSVTGWPISSLLAAYFPSWLHSIPISLCFPTVLFHLFNACHFVFLNSTALDVTLLSFRSL